ncbi:MAG: histidine phosphatase family protein [Gammaproteobacteria bacterium]
MRLILSRHGNTFNPGEPAVCVGAKNDLPLVDKGREQAQQLAGYLKKSQIIPAAIYCSPLQRTIEYGKIVSDTIQRGAAHISSLRPTIEPCLNELDYGDWTGLTSQEIIVRFGQGEFEHWEKNSVWPTTGNWGSSEKTITQEIQSFVTDLTKKYSLDDTLLIISSNGRLRYFLKLIPGEFERHTQDGTFKVATGNICGMTSKNNYWSLDFWDIIPRP